MTSVQRVKKVLAGILMLVCCFALVTDPETGFYFVALILSVSLFLYAARSLIYYFTMARHMVGGKSILFRGIIVLDLAVFTFSMVDDPKLYIILYLLGMKEPDIAAFMQKAYSTVSDRSRKLKKILISDFDLTTTLRKFAIE